MVEHGLQEQCVAVLLDGAGYGHDGTVWGGEILLADYEKFQRLAHLQHLHLPGGDIAAVEPWRMAIAAGYNVLEKAALSQLVPEIPEDNIIFLIEMMEKGLNTPYTSSCGRLFDAVSALLGLRLTLEYEGQAAMELESIARREMGDSNMANIVTGNKCLLPVSLDLSADVGIIRSDRMIETLLHLQQDGTSHSLLALEFHRWLIESLTAALKNIRAVMGDTKPVLLSGGCMQNSLLCDGLVSRLRQENFQVFAGNQVPMNDGGIALGQAAIGGYLATASSGE
jgi:hydrogenase maturation protein HypF